jgi:predicted AAA+ superfamily ATPase
MDADLETRIVYGSYPQVIASKTDNQRRKILENIRDGYLLKDILVLDNLKDSIFVFHLLRLIAFQIGHDISYSELAQNLNVHPDTVRRYLELLEKTFIIYSRQGYSRNLRKEYTKTPRYYFGDNGIRNVLISNFNSLHSRDDIGALWENYCVSERQKRNAYKNIFVNSYYWRTYDQKEIDLVEEHEGKLFGYEMKWGNDRAKIPKDFLATYQGAVYHVIHKENYLDFIT